MPPRSPGHSSPVNEDLYTGPTLLAPGASDRGDRMARKAFLPLAVFFLAVLAVFYIFFSVTVVKGESMEPSLLDEDRLLTSKSYSVPHRGDIVVFRTVDSQDHREDLIKRVIAIEGDSVAVEHGVATVNGVVEQTSSLTVSPDDPTEVPLMVIQPGTVFVLGDNRPIALDSRDIGAVPLAAVRGRAVFLFAPISRMRVVR